MANAAMPQRDHAHPVHRPLYGAAADQVRDQLREPSDLEVAIHVARLTLAEATPRATDIAGIIRADAGARECLRILLRALGAEGGEGQ